MKKIFQGLFDRLKEPSTHATITAVLLSVGVSANDVVVQSVVLVTAGVSGLLGFFLKEGK